MSYIPTFDYSNTFKVCIGSYDRRIYWNSVSGNQGYELYRSADLQNWTLISTPTTGATYYQFSPNSNLYYWKIRTKISDGYYSEFSEIFVGQVVPTSCYSPTRYNFLWDDYTQIKIENIPFAGTNTSVTEYKLLTGNTYNNISTEVGVAQNDVFDYYPSTDNDKNYLFKNKITNSTYGDISYSYKILWNNPIYAPSGLTATNVSQIGLTLSWVNNNTSGIVNNTIQIYSGGTWVKYSDVSSGTTSINISGVFTGSTYSFQVIANASYISKTSETLVITNPPPPQPQAPTNLTATTISYTTIDIQWTNNGVVGANIIQTYNGSTWDDIATISSTATTYQLTGLDPYTDYTIRVSNRYSGTDYPSNEITVKTLALLPPLCDDTWENRFTISGATCGNTNGQIIFKNPDYLLFYDVVIRDVASNYYYFDTDPTSATFGQSQYLYAGWYAIQAIPKTEFANYYDNKECRITWIPIEATDTTLSLDNISIRNAICGGFGDVKGRIVYFMGDSVSNTYDFYFYKDKPNELDGDLIDFQENLTPTQISQLVEAPLEEGTYYAILYNKSNGCILLLGPHIITAESLRSVSGIKRLFVTEWNNQVEYNYWSDSDEDYYVSGVDSEFFNSIKIKEFIDSTLPSAWFEIKMDTKGITYKQVMNKTHQGFIFTDTIEITIPHADNDKWKQLIDFLTNRYIIVFQDNNSNWWVMGYRLGAKANGYKRSNNEYILTLNAISDNKLVTNIAEDYVNNNIIQ